MKPSYLYRGEIVQRRLDFVRSVNVHEVRALRFSVQRFDHPQIAITRVECKLTVEELFGNTESDLRADVRWNDEGQDDRVESDVFLQNDFVQRLIEDTELFVGRVDLDGQSLHGGQTRSAVVGGDNGQ